MSKFKCPGHKRGDVPHDWGKMMLIHEGGPTWTNGQIRRDVRRCSRAERDGHGQCTEFVLMNFEVPMKSSDGSPSLVFLWFLIG